MFMNFKGSAARKPSSVENLWMNGEFPVQNDARKYFSATCARAKSAVAGRMWMRLRGSLRLTHGGYARRIQCAPTNTIS